MITAEAFAGKSYAVLGLARSGAATVRALLASGAHVMAWDDDHKAAQSLIMQIKEDRRQQGSPVPSFQLKNWLLAKDLSDFDAIIVSPGVPLNRHPVKAKAERYGLPIIGDIELFARARPELPSHKVVGITGTNGKSTTTALIHHILKTAGVPATMGGNIGLPILAQDPLPESGVYVLELSSYQIDLTQSLDCDVAVLLNITPDHLDRYESFEAYAASKERLLEMQSSDHAIVFGSSFHDGRRATYDRYFGPGPDQRKVQCWRADCMQDPADLWDPFDSTNWLSVQKDWPSLQGPHNAENAGAAMGVASVLGLSNEQMDQGLRT
ncbi:MAG TPA: Mur ligase family protein, partial [Sphingomicrobium sp.]|nr:Mur ligase family protein [Sphingomicrobium sp.]